MDIAPHDLTEIVRTLGSIATIWNAVRNIKIKKVDAGINRRDQGLPDDVLESSEKEYILQQLPDQNFIKFQDRIALLTISPTILSSIETRLKSVLERITKTITEAIDIDEIEEERAISQREICYLLQVVLDHNSGKFPAGGGLESLWKEFRCTIIYPKYGIRSK